MKKQPWIFTQNVFWNATKKSFKKFVKLSRKHDSSLAAKVADPFFAALYALYHPLHVAFIDAFTEWKNAGEKQQGTTKAVKTLLKKLQSELIKKWDIAIQAVYLEGTDEYKGILPNGRTPFQSGGQDERITAVKSLLKKVSVDAALNAIKQQVDTFIDAVNTAMGKKDGNISDTKGDGKALVPMQFEACEVMFDNLCDLLKHFKGNRTAAEDFYDMGILRDHRQDEFNETVKKSETKSVVERTMDAKDTMRIKVGVAPMRIFSVADEKQTSSDVYVDLAANKIHTINALQIDNNKDKPFIQMQNRSDLIDGKFELEFE